MTGPADRDERERIRTSLDETLVVEAAAGTGKTTELVGRLINVLAEGRGTVETVAAVTFTDKAAGELKLRLRAGLEAARRESPSVHRRHHLEDAIARLEEARIGTIHGFCADLLRERPVEACADPGFQVLAEPQAQELYGRAFNAWIETSLQDPPEGVRRALRRQSLRDSQPDKDDGPIDRLRTAGWNLASWRHLRAPWRRPHFDRATRVGEVLDRLHTLVDHLATCSNQSDDLFSSSWAARRLSADILAIEREQPRDLDGLEARPSASPCPPPSPLSSTGSSMRASGRSPSAITPIPCRPSRGTSACYSGSFPPGAPTSRNRTSTLEARAIPHLLVGGKSFHLREEVESLRTATAHRRATRSRLAHV